MLERQIINCFCCLYTIIELNSDTSSWSSRQTKRTYYVYMFW